MLRELDRQLSFESVVPTHTNVLGRACLRALTHLTTGLQYSSLATVLPNVEHLLRSYFRQPSAARHMRAEAAACLLQLAACGAAAGSAIAPAGAGRVSGGQANTSAAAAAGGGGIGQVVVAQEAGRVLRPLEAVVAMALGLLGDEGLQLQLQAGLLAEALVIMGQIQQQQQEQLQQGAAAAVSAAAAGGMKGDPSMVSCLEGM